MRRADRRVVWSPQAEDDLLAIWAYLAQAASEQLADRQLRDIDTACGSLLRHPLKGRAREELVPGIRSLLVSPYIVFYRAGDRAIQVVRILHGHRDIDVIFSDDSGDAG